MKEKKKKSQKKAKNAFDLLMYEKIYKNGLCEIEDGLYSIACTFTDINYQIARKDVQVDIFSKWCEFLNFFDSSYHIQLNIRCFKTNVESLKDEIIIKNNDFDEITEEVNNFIVDCATLGDNSITQEKTVIISFHASSYQEACIIKGNLENDIYKNFLSLDPNIKCSFHGGVKRIEDLHSYFNPPSPIIWDYTTSSITSKEYISPFTFNFKENNNFYFSCGNQKRYGSTVFLKNFPSDLTDRLLSNISSLPITQTITLHIDTVDQIDALKQVENRLTDLDQERAEYERKNQERGLPIFNLPRRLQKAIEDTEEFQKNLTDEDQSMFRVSLYVYVEANTLEELETNTEKVLAIARKSKVILSYPFEQQLQCLNSILPIGKNHLGVKRTLHTASTAIMIPFTGQELLDHDGICYGTNAHTGRLLMIDKRKLKNPNSFIVGVPGSGKSFIAKLEQIQEFLKYSDDQIIIIDPEREYSALAEEFRGTVIRISNDSKTHINPMDINDNYGGEDEDPIKAKADYLLTLFEMLIGGKNGLADREVSILDRTITLTYGKYKEPTLLDFWNMLKLQPEDEAKGLALSLETYVTGSLSIFANKTNVDLSNKFIVIDTKDLGSRLNKMGILVAQEMIWNFMSKNRNLHRRTFIYIDEVHLLFQNAYSAEYCDKLWKRARKWGGFPTGITQNISALLKNDTTSQIISNCEFLIIMNQAKDDRVSIAQLLGLSDNQIEYINNADAGTGIIRAGSSIVPFKAQFPKDTKLYKTISTKFQEIGDN